MIRGFNYIAALRVVGGGKPVTMNHNSIDTADAFGNIRNLCLYQQKLDKNYRMARMYAMNGVPYVALNDRCVKAL
jgi:hypothetical protein